MAVDVSAKALLTPFVHHSTAVRAPIRDTDFVDDKPVVTVRESDTATIDVDVCSELTEVASASSIAKGTHKLAIVAGPSGSPVIFSIGTDDRLYCTWHVDGASTAWQFRDVTPAGQNAPSVKAKAFDVLQLPGSDGLIHIGAAVVSDGNVKTGECDVYRCANLNLAAVLANVQGEVPWVKAPNNLQAFPVHTLRIAPSRNAAQGKPPVPSYIIAGTLEHGATMASNYLVSMDPVSQEPWSRHSIPTDAHVIVDVTPGLLPGSYGPGIFSLYRIEPEDTPHPNDITVGTQVRFRGLDELTNIDPTLEKIGGTARSISTSINASGYTDLFVAGKTGIGYWPCTKLDGESKNQLLQGYDIRQVVAHESNRKITVIATSVSGELFVVEGVRPPGGPLQMPIWSSSDIPIRADVQMSDVLRNPTLGFSQLVYVSSDRGIKHLVKDPATTLWQENSVHVESADITNIPAYVSQITLRDTEDNAVHEGYEVGLSSSQPCYVAVNDRTYELGAQPVEVHTDSSGQIRVVLETESGLAAPTFTVHLQSSSARATIAVDPSQRVLRKLLAVQSGDDIANATDALGNRVFAPGQVAPDTAAGMAHVCRALPSMLDAADKGALARLGPGTDAAPRAVVEATVSCDNGALDVVSGDEVNGSLWQTIVDAAGNVYHRVAGFVKDVVDKAFDFVGDVLEGLVRGLIRVFKAAWAVVGDKLRIVFEVAGKVLSFVCDAVAPIVGALCSILKAATGIDLKKIWNWLAAKLAPTRVQETQTVITNFIKNGITLYGNALTANKPYIMYLFEHLRATIDIPDKRVPREGEKRDTGKKSIWSVLKGIFGAVFDIVFNNPIAHGVRKVLGRILNAIQEELGDDVRFPSMQPIIDVFAEIIPTLAAEQGALLQQLVDDVGAKFADVLRGERSLLDGIKAVLGDAFWTLFDSLQSITAACIDVVGKLVEAFINFLSGTWEIPVVSALWRFVTGSDLSILNVLAYLPALGMTLASAILNDGKLPFEVWPDPSTFLPSAESLIAKVPDAVPHKPSNNRVLVHNTVIQAPANVRPPANELSSATNFASMQADASPFVSLHKQAAFELDMEKSESTALVTNAWANDDPASKRMRHYRLVESSAGTATAVFQLLHTILEMLGAGVDLKNLNDTGTLNWTGKWKYRKEMWPQPEAYNAQKWVQGAKCALKVLIAGCHIALTVTTFVDSPLGCKNSMGSLRLLGALVSVGASVVGIYGTTTNQKHVVRIGDVGLAVGNATGFVVAGIIQFACSDQGAWDWARFVADESYFVASGLGVAATLINKPILGLQNPALIPLAGSAGATLAGLISSSVLLHAYRTNNVNALKYKT